MPTVIGLTLIGALWYHYSRNGDKIIFFYILIAVISGLALSLPEFTDPKLGLQYYLLLISGFFIVSGIARFVLFTKQNPVQTVEEEL
jgi:uncharacterized membrane protein HdeD (DUF308 family)